MVYLFFSTSGKLNKCHHCLFHGRQQLVISMFIITLQLNLFAIHESSSQVVICPIYGRKCKQ
ncbi:hypothetical protein NC651_002176 [Populus alba x Populus x berolinensis]|nr:hypothetical protein NC651_002176 [Populus alba x Populus x berolinensis]